MNLSEKKCVACEGGVLAFNPDQTKEYLKIIGNSWNVSDNKKIVKEFRFKNYGQTMSFVNQVARVAEEEDHHPIMQVHYGKVIIELRTHSIGGLSENDFILAAKINQLIPQ